jgi:hypothetical protein
LIVEAHDQRDDRRTRGDRPLDLVLARLQGVRRNGHGYESPCPACGDRKTHLSVREAEDGKVLVKCFKDCLLEDILDAIGLEKRDLFPQPAADFRPRRPREDMNTIWKESMPDGGRVAEYFRHRGLSGSVPDALRSHPALPYYEGRCHIGDYPAIVAQVQRLDGKATTLHRTYLDPTAAGKASVPEPKKLMRTRRRGDTRGAAVRLAPVGPRLALAEGIETAMAVMESTGTPAWATVSAGGMESVELPPEGMEIEIWADNDENAAGQKAATELAARLKAEGRTVYMLVPPNIGQDWLDVLVAEGPARLRAALAEAQPWTPRITNNTDPFASWQSAHGTYTARQGVFFREKSTKDGPIDVPISNFVARVDEDVIRDDGAEEQRAFMLTGRMASGRPLPRREVPAHQFEGLSWLPKTWGPEPSALPGQKDHTAYAIRMISGEVPRRMVYAHLGWRKVDGNWAYLHSGGAVGADTAVEVDVTRDRLDRFMLPGDAGDPREAMRISLEILEIGRPRVVYPAWCLPWRAVVCELLPCPVLAHFVGPTGSLKSTIAAASEAHFGRFRTKDDLPARFEFTDNIIEKGTFLAKDTLYMIDDLNPEHTRIRKDELERRFSRLASNVGNLTGRRRMRSDAGTRPEFWPRGFVLSTGEYTPPLSQSRMARTFPVPFEKGMIDLSRLTALQKRLDMLPYAMRAFIEYVRPDFEMYRNTLPERLELLRDRAGKLGAWHARLPENVAHLFLGLELGIAFAVHVGTLDRVTAARHLDIGFTALKELADEHGRTIVDERPTQAFLGAIAEALAAGRVWLADRSTGMKICGRDDAGCEKVGWIDADGIYLLPVTSYRLAATRLDHRGGVQISERALHKALEDERLLLRDPSEPNRLAVNRWCEGGTKRVLWLRSGALGDQDGNDSTVGGDNG